jgi:hypothetical protein
MIGSPIRVGRDPLEITIGEGAVWGTNAQDNSVSGIDPSTGKVSTR